MGDQRKKGGSRLSKYIPFGSASGSGGSDLAKDPPGGLASEQYSDPQPGQSSEEQQAALSLTISRSSRFWNKMKRRSPSPSPSPGVEGRSNVPDQPMATSSQSLAVPTASVLAQHHSSPSDSSGLPPTSVGGYSPPSSSCAQVPSTVFASAPIIQILQPQSEPVANEIPAPPPTCSPHIPTPTCQVLPQLNSVSDPGVNEPSSQVWAKALEIVKQKLSDNNLPPLDLTNLTSQSAEENIEAVVKALNNAQDDDKKKRWSYTWCGKEVIVVERWGKILKNVEKYSGVVGTAIQSNPQVALNHVEAIEGFEAAIAALLEKLSICEFYAGIYIEVSLSSQSTANTLQVMLDSALPELYAAVIVFAVKARGYFETRGIKKVASALGSFNIEFQPYIDEINAKEGVIRECADAATMKRIQEIEGVIQNITSELKSLAKLDDISITAARTLKMTEVIRNNTENQLLTMLTPLEPLKRHQDVKLHRTKNAAAWLLRHESFRKWRDSNILEEGSRVFCCYGIPGAGKTVISSVVIDDLYARFYKVDPNIGIACLYADYKDQNNQTLDHILGSFLRQLLTTTPKPIPDEVIEELNDIQRRGGKAGSEDILALLKIQLQQLKHAFICIDAVDELETKVQQHLLDVLKDLGTNNQSANNTRLFFTGRDHIESEVQKRLQVMQQYKIAISASEQDIQEFLGQQMEDDQNPGAMDEVLANDIIDAIVKKSQGMFLLPSLHIKMVLGMPTKSKRRKALERLPTDLYDSFQGVIVRIRECLSASQAELGLRVLMWLHFAYRPLKLEELQHALAVEKSDTEFDADNIPSQKALLDCCLGLVIVDEETSIVRFVHYTLEQFFRKLAGVEFPNGYSSIAETCLTYLTFGKLRQHFTLAMSPSGRTHKYPFLNYAALHWGTYVKHQCNDNLTRLANMILDHDGKSTHFAIHILYWELDKSPIATRTASGFLGVHVAAYFGLGENMAYFCSMGRNMGLKDDHGRTPLSLAAEYGHESIVQMLIKRDDVDINAKDNHERTPLSLAAMDGHEAVVRLLIERGDVDINSKDNTGRIPLSWAAMRGHEAVVRLLIERGDVDINSKDNFGRIPVSLAALCGREAVARLLIERGDVDIHSKDNIGWTPLSLAAMRGHNAVVRLLIERGDVDINSKDNDGRTPLSWAAMYGWGAVVRLLIERGDVDINSKDNDGRTPLSWAAMYGRGAVAQLLIERGDVGSNSKDNGGRTPLSLGAMRGHEAVARLLIEKGDVDINSKDNNGRTPLSLAARKGHEAVVRLMIEQGDVDINSKDNNGRTPLSLAAMYGHKAVVRLLNDRCSVQATD